MLYISILEDLITDPNAEEGLTISISEKENLSAVLLLLEKKYLYLHISSISVIKTTERKAVMWLVNL
jgi:hypothetical protein